MRDGIASQRIGELLDRLVPRRKQKPVGQALVELALGLPVFVLLLLGAIDLGAVMYGYVAVSSAVQSGAEYAGRTQPYSATYTSTQVGDIYTKILEESGADSSRAGGFLTTSNTPLASVTVVGQTGQQIKMVVVTAAYTYTPPISFPGIPSSVPITVHAAAPVCPVGSLCG